MSQNKKKKNAVFNRRLAWITLFILIVMNVSTYADYFKLVTWLKTTSIISSMIFITLFFIHGLMSVYLFGFPKFKWQIRVVHIYIGYFLFAFTLLSQSLIGFEPFHIILFTFMWISIVAHVSLSIRFAVKRNVKKQPEPMLAFRGENNL